MNRYIIGAVDIGWSNNRFNQCHAFSEPKTRKGYIGLYDRNKNNFLWFRIERKFQSHYAYLTERNTPITGYWKNLKKSIGKGKK